MDHLVTQRLHLQPSSHASAKQVLEYELRNRDFFTPWVPLRTGEWFLEETQQRRLKQESDDAQHQLSYRFFMKLKSDADHIVGDVSISNIVRGAFWSAYLGYKIDEAQQGQGLMREAVFGVMQFGFQSLRLHRLEANIIPRNTRSVLLAENLHFQREGYSVKYLCINGVWEDHLRYAMTAEQFEAQSQL
jgi:ribosomal-protein-alanine N-acetyltransferase